MEIEHARDLLQETIDALPAGVVLYDKDERLVMFNKAAASIAPHIADAGAIGKTYSQMAYETERELDAKGTGRIEGAKEWIARFRSKGIRHLRPAPGGRWVEWMEKGTSSGGTVGLRVDVTDLKKKELEIERARADYQSLVDLLSDMVYALDFNGRLRLRQRRCHRLAGNAGRGRRRQALCRFPGGRRPGARHRRRPRPPAIDGRCSAPYQPAHQAG